MRSLLKRVCMFTTTTLLIAGTASAGTFYQSDENTPIVEGLTAQADFRAASGTLQQVDFDAFVKDQVLTGAEFAAEGINLVGVPFGNDPDSNLIPFPGFSRCISVDPQSGAIFVVDSTSTTQSGQLEISFDTPSQSVGVTIMLDPEGGDNRSMEVYGPGNVLIETTPLDIFDDSDNLSSAFVGWVGTGAEVAEKVIISFDSDGMGYCSIEFNGTNVAALGAPHAIPTTSFYALLLLAGMLGMLGFFAVRAKAG